ncbi:MAG: ComEC/Rec2 family competence protein [Steroidobacter sp.]
MGDGQWILIDSCRGERRGLPLHLAYLQSLGVRESAVSHVVISHWHDDHIDGISEVVAACPNAKVVYSAALTSQEFLSLVRLFSSRATDRQDSGLREMIAVDRIIQERMTQDGNRNRAACRTRADHRLWARGGADADVQIIALSPSDGSIERAHREISMMLERLSASPQSLVLPSTNRNHYSIVLWLQWHSERVLLGGDLEVVADTGCGWKAVLSCNQFPDARARIVKVAHHGSPNGDDPSIWEQLVAPDAVACLTSFTRGKTKRPAPEDLKRIRQFTSKVYATTLPRGSPSRRDNAVEKELSALTKSRKALNRNPGQIRIRWPQSQEPVVETGGAALQV